jgi:hypothetical protein
LIRIEAGPRGFRVQLGGKLGRHPTLAPELPGLFTWAGVTQLVRSSAELFTAQQDGFRRFADLLSTKRIRRILKEHGAGDGA